MRTNAWQSVGRHHHYSAYAVEDAGAIIRIMSKIYDGMWNTGAPHHNHAVMHKGEVVDAIIRIIL
jgi:hypothetical protein